MSLLATDRYELSMVRAYWREKMEGTAVFELFVRRLPPGRSFLVAAGLESVVSFLESFRFGEAELSWLSSTQRLERPFLDYLESLRFEGDVRAMPEGTVFFADEPLLQVIAPLPQAQLVETWIMNAIHYPTLVASKAARCHLHARGRLLVEFGMRRAPSGEAAHLAARASYLAGFHGTSNLMAAFLFGIPSYGTMAHSYIQAHENEAEAFEKFGEAYPKANAFLLDTYDSERAARLLCELAPQMARGGIAIDSVRLDSGDLHRHSVEVRKILDHAGLKGAKIFASGDLDEYEIASLLARGAPIDGFGVGTRLDTSDDSPFLHMAYKIQEYAGIARRKKSEHKATWPGRKQVFRRYDDQGTPIGDTIGLAGESIQGQPLLEPILQKGARVVKAVPSLAELRDRCIAGLARLPGDLKSLTPSSSFPVEISPGIRELARRIDESHKKAA